MEYSGISELFQVVYSSAIALHMLSGRAYVTALPASYTVYFGTYYFSIHLPLSLIEQLSTTMLKRKHLCYTGNSNDKQFPGEISKHVMHMTLRSYVHQLSKLDKTKTQH